MKNLNINKAILCFLMFVGFQIVFTQAQDPCITNRRLKNNCILKYEGCQGFQSFVRCYSPDYYQLSEQICLRDCCEINSSTQFTQTLFEQCKLIFQQQDQQEEKQQQSSRIFIIPIVFGSCCCFICICNYLKKKQNQSSNSNNNTIKKNYHQQSSFNKMEQFQSQNSLNDKDKVYQTINNSVCCICLQASKLNCILLCGHCFHANCINQWSNKKKSCPLCVSQQALSAARIYTLSCNNCGNIIIGEKYQVLNFQNSSRRNKQKNNKIIKCVMQKQMKLREQKQLVQNQLCFRCKDLDN